MYGAGYRVLRAEPALIGEGEQRLGADHHGEVALELGELAGTGIVGRECMLERGKRDLDQPEPDARADRGELGPGDGLRDHGPYRSGIGEHAPEEELARERDPLDRIAGRRDRLERLGRAGPQAVDGLAEQRHQVGEVPVGGGL